MSLQDSGQTIPVYFEVGQKRIIAGAVDWPGWFRSGKNEATALQALFESAPRYGHILSSAGVDFRLPTQVFDLRVVERLQGDGTTDYGAPGKSPSADQRPLGQEGLRRMQSILSAIWNSFEGAVAGAKGKDLRKGPRGGGRDIDAIVRHVYESERSYARRIGISLPGSVENLSPEQVEVTHQVILDALASQAELEMPGEGPRGGKLWMPRYFIRRDAYHFVDHIWEIEDRQE